MRSLLHRVLCAALLLGAVSAAFAASPAITPAARAVLDRSITAMGGVAAIGQVGTLVMEGTMEIPVAKMRATFSSRRKRPNLVLIESTLSGVGKTAQGFDGTTAWTNDPLQGYRELKVPFRTRTTSPAMEITSVVTSVVVNVPIEDSVFAPQR